MRFNIKNLSLIGASLILLQNTPAFASEECSVLLGSPYSLSLKMKESASGRQSIQLLQGGTFISESINSLFRAFHKPMKLDIIAETIGRLEKDQRDLPYFTKLVEAAGVKVHFNEKALANIPKTGGGVIISNHPLLGMDGLAIAAAVSEVRPDTKVVLNSMLGGVTGLPEHAILVNPFGTKAASAFNRIKMKEMNEYVKNGGILLIFPSGSPSQKFTSQDLMAYDQAWKKGIIHLMKQGLDVPVIPVFTEGQPSGLYLKTKLYADPIAQAMVMTEIGRQANTQIRLEIGSPIYASTLQRLTDAEKLDYLRARTYLLGHRYISELKAEKIIEPQIAYSESAQGVEVVIRMTGLISIAEAKTVLKMHSTAESLLELIVESDTVTRNLLQTYADRGATVEDITSDMRNQFIDIKLKLNRKF